MNVYFRKQINKQAATCMTQRVYLHINLFVNIVYTLFVFLYICSNYNYVVMKRDTHGTGNRGAKGSRVYNHATEMHTYSGRIKLCIFNITEYIVAVYQ